MTGWYKLSHGSAADLDAVMDVMDDSFDPAFGEAWTAPQCSGLLPVPGVWLTLARAGDEIIGFALARIIVDEAELLLLAVKKKWQRRGVGQQLLESFSATARRRGAERLHLEVRNGNLAVKLYKQAGFSEVGRRRGYYSGRDGQVYDALTLSRKP
jgi:ribosomal-protein-alanine N-acetyltransferase